MPKEPFLMVLFLFFKPFFHLVGYASALVEAGGAIESYAIYL